MSLTQGGGQLPEPSVLSEFQPDVNNLRNFAYSQGGQVLPPGAFTPSQGTNAGATVGNNYFGAGGAGQLGISQLQNILGGNNLNPASNPYLQQNIGAMQQAFGKGLGTAQDNLNAQFALSGQSGNSGARYNADTQLATNATQNFGNSVADFLGNNYEQGQNQITSALGLLNQPLQGANMAGSLGQAPGQIAYQGQQAQNQLSALPFNYINELMQNAPVGQPAYAPSEPSGLSSILNTLFSGIGSGALAYGAFA